MMAAAAGGKKAVSEALLSKKVQRPVKLNPAKGGSLLHNAMESPDRHPTRPVEASTAVTTNEITATTDEMARTTDTSVFEANIRMRLSRPPPPRRPLAAPSQSVSNKGCWTQCPDCGGLFAQDSCSSCSSEDSLSPGDRSELGDLLSTTATLCQKMAGILNGNQQH
ncbi:uncharacterized protein LOC135401288 [Ornithodoros turicata]|uniref:uncharacterized protein LOC135401288 n=1 Tax=Ornithodoros turicata TaxID=34597 RepID=UPI00313A059A